MPTSYQSPCRGTTSVACDVAGHGSVRTTADGVRVLRQQLVLPDGKPLPASFLKHVDDQTVAALAAVFQALGRLDTRAADFTDWAVLAAPRFLGRTAMVSSLQRFTEEGAWGVSPHLIPHRSLHSISGTISQVLQVRGPNFGVGGGPDVASEAFLTAAALLGRERLAGVWLVLTGWQPEPMPGQTVTPTCSAAALALQYAGAARHALHLKVTPEVCPAAGRTVSVEAVVDALIETPLPQRVEWAMDGGGSVELEHVGAGMGAFPNAERRAG